MSDNTLTIALEGDVSLMQFVEALNHFRNLVDQLSREVSPGTHIDWQVDDLQAGSAMATIVGLAAEPEPVLRVVKSYSQVGEALQKGEPIPFSKHVRLEAKALTRLIQSKITAVRFETADSDHIVYGEGTPTKKNASPLRTSFGMVRGRVQTLTSRDKLKFTLYDAVMDRPINCYLDAGQENLMREIWDQEVVVVGRVTREPEQGRPVNVRNISSIEPVKPITPTSFRAARGILTWSPNDEPAEVSMRRLRDAEA